MKNIPFCSSAECVATVIKRESRTAGCYNCCVFHEAIRMLLSVYKYLYKKRETVVIHCIVDYFVQLLHNSRMKLTLILLQGILKAL